MAEVDWAARVVGGLAVLAGGIANYRVLALERRAHRREGLRPYVKKIWPPFYKELHQCTEEIQEWYDSLEAEGNYSELRQSLPRSPYLPWQEMDPKLKQYDPEIGRALDRCRSERDRMLNSQQRYENKLRKDELDWWYRTV